MVTGYEGLIDQLTLPDPDDRHVLAAAIRVHAGVIVTHNIKDFPLSQLRPPTASRLNTRTNRDAPPGSLARRGLCAKAARP